MSARIELAEQFIATHPQAAARVLEEVAPPLASTYIDAVRDEHSVNLLAEMLPFHAAKSVALLSPAAAARYLAAVEPRVAARILRHVPGTARDAIVEGLPRRLAVQIGIILNYSRAMVGAWVEPMVLTLPADCQVGAAKSRLHDDGYVDYHRIYVVDAEQNLEGFVKIVRLLQASDDSPLADYLEHYTRVLRASTSVDMALEDSGWLDSDYLPVVDRRGQFLGVLRYATLRSAAHRPRTAADEYDVSSTFLDLAETCYLGLAEVINASLAAETPPDGDGGR